MLTMQEFWPRDCGPHDAGNEAAAGEMLLSLVSAGDTGSALCDHEAALGDCSHKIAGGEGAGGEILAARLLARRLR